MASGNFPSALRFVLTHEGGWSDHPQDPGGATMRGITLTTYRQWMNNPQLTAVALRTISEETVAAIYWELYWLPTRSEETQHGVDLMVFDMAVNAGVRRSIQHLQESLNTLGRGLEPTLAVDGVFGPLTMAATLATDPVRLIAALGERHERHYRGLVHFPVFGRGWLRRVTDRVAQAHTLHNRGGVA